jgi:hypothetical protein
LTERSPRVVPFEELENRRAHRCHHRSCFLFQRLPGLQSFIYLERLARHWLRAPALGLPHDESRDYLSRSSASEVLRHSLATLHPLLPLVRS